MIEIQHDSKDLLENLMLHDAEISELLLNYNKHTVSIPLKLDSGTRALLRFENVKYSDVSIFEPWGEGIYIYEVSISKAEYNLDIKEDVIIDPQYFNTSILLNSGDRFNLISSKIIYTEIDS